MRRNRRPAAAIMLTLGLAGVALGASGCSLASPKVIATPYAAADGTNAELPLPGGSAAVQFRNVLLVSAEKGKPGVLVGAVATTSGQPVQVQLSVLDGSGKDVLGQAVVTARPGRLALVGSGTDATNLQVPEVPVVPGSVLRVHAQAASGGTEFDIPVLAPTQQYATVTPTSVPSPSPSADTSEPASPTGSPSGSASPSASPAKAGTTARTSTPPRSASPSAS